MNDLFGSESEKAKGKRGALSPAAAKSVVKGAARPALNGAALPDSDYSAKDIEVLEGLEPVRRRPGMYIGGTDERALHHLFAEVLDNAMDEAVAGHAKIIEVTLDADGALTVRDDGRGMPVDPHPKYPGQSALEVIMTMLHSGGKFSGKAYETSGGLHGVGVSVVNALSEQLEVQVWRDGFEWRQAFSRGKPTGPLQQVAPSKKKGTAVRFLPDPQIFGEGAAFKPARLYRMARSKAYLFRGVEIRWKCAACRRKFSLTSGTVLHCRKLSLRDILAVIALWANGVKGTSALQMSRNMNVGAKSIFVMLHKLRESLGATLDDGELVGIVEVDGAYVPKRGPKVANKAADRVSRRAHDTVRIAGVAGGGDWRAAAGGRHLCPVPAARWRGPAA